MHHAKRLFPILLIVTLALLALSSANTPTAAQDTTPAPYTPWRTHPLAVLGRPLGELHMAYTAQQQQAGRSQVQAEAARLTSPLLTTIDGYVVLDAVAEDDPARLRTAMDTLGLRGGATAGRVVSGEFPIDALPALAALDSLRFARPALLARNTGSVTSQGDSALVADTARSTFGVSGSGVRVGILSDSFACLSTRPSAADDVASGDVPPDVRILDDFLQSGCIDEGRAMAQIIHDVAPGASLSFHTASRGVASFAQGIRELAADGARVVVDDIGYLSEPFFQDGVIAQAAADVVAQGAVYLSSAGNQGSNSYESSYRPTVANLPVLEQVTVHDFDPSAGGTDISQQITIPPFQSLLLVLQWDSPFASTGLGAAGSPNDVDIYLFDSTLTTLLAAADDFNEDGDAIEALEYTNPTAEPLRANLVIVHFSGPAPGLLKYIPFGGDMSIDEYATQSSTIFGHPNVAGALAVGAAAYFETPVFGLNTPLLQSFSARGPTPILFDEQGTRLAVPEVRPKPDIVAPDSVNTTFFGSDTDFDGFPNFSGTSAAAPHAAGVVALLLQAQPNLTPQQVSAALAQSALDMGQPGFDTQSGAGLIQADAALAQNTGVAGVALSPAQVSQSAEPAEVVQYTFFVTNTGQSDDTFTLTVADSSFAVVLPDPVGPLAPGAGQQVVLTVEVPADALPGSSDSATLTVASQRNAATTAAANITTNVVGAVDNSLEISPPFTAQQGRADTLLTYTVVVTNTGSSIDSFTVSVNSTTALAIDAPTVLADIAPGTSRPLSVQVRLPADAAVGDSATVTLVLTSQGAPTVSAAATLVATVDEALTAGVALAPPIISRGGPIDSVVVYGMTLTNTGNVRDTFTLVASGGKFAASLPDTVGPLAAGEAIMVPVAVTIPAGAAVGSADTLVLVATSQVDPTTSGSASLTTIVIDNPRSGVALVAEPAQQVGLPGEVLTATLVLTNTGNVNDTFTLAVGESTFAATLPITQVTLVNGTSTRLPVRITLPADAADGVQGTTVISGTSVRDPATSAQATLTSEVAFFLARSSSPTPLGAATALTVSSVLDTTPQTFLVWDFGDGSPAQSFAGNTGLNVSYVYTRTGTYTATVRAFDDTGSPGVLEEAQFALPVVVTPPVLTLASSSPTIIGNSTTLTVTLDKLALAGVTSVELDYGDGTPPVGSAALRNGSSILSFSRTYASEGLYTAQVRLLLDSDVYGSRTLVETTTAVEIIPATGVPASLSLSAAASELPADGVSTTTIVATVRDGAGNPLPGVLVSFSSTSGTLGVASASTSTSGTATVALRAGNASGIATVTGVVGQLSASTDVAFVAQFDSTPATLDLVSQASLVAPGGSTVLLATVQNAAGQPVPNVRVSFSSTGGAMSPAALLGLSQTALSLSTNTNGVATIRLNVQNEPVTVTARVDGLSARSITVRVSDRGPLLLPIIRN